MIYEPLNRPITILSLGYYVHRLGWQNILCSKSKAATKLNLNLELTLTCRAYRRQTINRQSQTKPKRPGRNSWQEPKPRPRQKTKPYTNGPVCTQCVSIVCHHARAQLLKHVRVRVHEWSPHLPGALPPTPSRSSVSRSVSIPSVWVSYANANCSPTHWMTLVRPPDPRSPIPDPLPISLRLSRFVWPVKMTSVCFAFASSSTPPASLRSPLRRSWRSGHVNLTFDSILIKKKSNGVAGKFMTAH